MQKALRIAALILAVMVVVVLAVAPASAAPALQGGGNGSGNGSSGNGNNAGGNSAGGNNGGTGMNNWQTLQPGQRVEYIFTYAGGNDPAAVQLMSNPLNAVQFNVFTPDQWSSGATDMVGKGTTQTSTDKDTGVTTARNNGGINWTTASSGGSQTYHVQVYSTSQQPAQYWINATGAGSLVAFNANARNTNLQGQSTQGTTGNAGANASGNASSNTGAKAGTSAGGGTSGNNNNLPAPRTLPRTGSSDLAVLFAAAAAALITGGWLARRRTN